MGREKEEEQEEKERKEKVGEENIGMEENALCNVFLQFVNKQANVHFETRHKKN